MVVYIAQIVDQMIMLEHCGFATITINVDCAHLIICCAGSPQLIKIVAASTE